MAQENEQDQEKTEDPSQYRLEEFRAKGIVATSRELVGIFILSACSLALILSSVSIYENVSNFFQWILFIPAEEAFKEKYLMRILTEGMKVIGKSVLPVFFASVSMTLFSHIIQIGFIFTTETLGIDFERINPVSGFKRIASWKAIVELIKTIFKFVVILVITYLVMKSYTVNLTGHLQVNFLESFLYGKTILIKLSFSLIGGLLLIALADLGWEKYSYHQRLKQTKFELKQEMKEKEGNPEIKQRIRSIQRELHRKRMLTNVAKADVIISNPTHISVAIKYNSDSMIAPLVVAKGADHLALKIREVAGRYKVPVVENVPLARTLYSTVKVGEAIPRPLYKAVAEILAFVFKLKRKEKALR